MKKSICIVLPVYNEQQSIPLIYRELKKLADSFKSKYVFELVFVNDGSVDDSGKRLEKIAQHDKTVVVINFSRNFGHQIAMTAGMDYSNADATITMDADLQDPPSICRLLIKKWEDGYDIVYAKRRQRKTDSIFKRQTAKFFYLVINMISDTPIPANVGDFRLIDQKVLNEAKKFREHHRFIRGMMSYVGFKQATVLYNRPNRAYGESNYPFKKMWRLAVDGITGFSVAPLKFISRLGYSVSILSLVGIIYVVAVKIFEPAREVPGWAFVTVSMFFIGGVQLIMLGVLGSYIARIYAETQNRPLYIISSIVGNERKSRN